MVRRTKDYVIELHCEPEDNKQLYFLQTLYEKCTQDQMMRSVILLIDELQNKLNVKVTMLEVKDFNTGRIIKTEIKDIPGPVTSTKELKEYERRGLIK